MSAETDSSIESVVLYIPLLNEGTEVLRPTTGLRLQSGLIQVLQTADYDPMIEEWEFPPGSLVRCITEVRGGREVLVARERVA
jgi:hypothetical protein